MRKTESAKGDHGDQGTKGGMRHDEEREDGEDGTGAGSETRAGGGLGIGRGDKCVFCSVGICIDSG